MTRKVISYFNKELGYYESLKVIENQPNQDIIGSCKRYLNLAPNQEVLPCVGRKIMIIGEFQDEDLSEPLVSYQEPILVVDCDEILKARFPQLYEQSNN